MTRKQSNKQWSGGIADHPAPNISESKIRWEISRLDFLRLRRHPPHWISSKGPNYQRGVLLISAGAIEGKMPLEGRQGCLVLHNNAPAHQALATRKNLGFQYIDHLPYSPYLAPSDYRLFPGLKKTIERPPFFVIRGCHCRHGDLVGRTNFLIFFLVGLQKLEQRAKKCTELRGEYVE